jgi:twitching motility protein PilT
VLERVELPKPTRTPTGYPPPTDSSPGESSETARMPALRAEREPTADVPREPPRVPASPPREASPKQREPAGVAREAVQAPRERAYEPAPLRAASESPRLAEWLRHAAALRASDLHLAEGECPCVRVDGALLQLDNAIIDDLAAILPLEAAQAARLARGESLDLALEIASATRVRAHIYTTFAGPAAALRLLPRAAPTFSSLNMPCAFDDLVELPHGLVLVCGAAGSGKSTTLAALAQEALRRRSIVLITLEDPIEYALVSSATSLVRRRQIGRDAPDFANGLRDALRADPDMLLLGELRDRETISMALTAAETGHLVLASMHSRSAASAIERVVDGFPGDQQQQVRVQLAESLRAVIAQRLLPRKHGEGRLPAIELLRVNRAVAALIRDSKSAQLASVLQSTRRDGMLALERCLADRVHAGEIDVDAAVSAANDAEALSQFLRH